MNKDRDIEKTLAAARQHCERRGARFTPIREQVLRLVIGYSGVVKAYDVLTDLQTLRGQTAPPTVYRALEFFVDMGILHRTESLNGFLYCADFEHEHLSLILNCNQCGRITELPAQAEMVKLQRFCAENGFALSSAPVVLAGLCQQCEKEDET